jgi:peptidyl-prolyl cis-trans isomerase SurA
MRIYYSLAAGLGLLLATPSATQAQTIFTYGNNSVEKEEFVRVYQKNNAQQKPDFSEQSLRDYIDLYALFKMKVKEAELLKRDTATDVRNELENYKNQLSRSYLSDKDANKELVLQAYERMNEEISVKHILVALRPNEDSTAAYRKIDSIYRVLNSGKASFESVANQLSDDKGSAVKDGDIGYITALQVVYPFENAAYNTAKGQISKPFRTQFGYHILKVADRRPARGQVQVAHILISAPKSKGEEGLQAAMDKIEKIKQELKAGASFESLAAKYSEDKFTSNKKGLLEPFGAGKMVPSFENAAFALKNPGDISEAVQTDYGVHLIKLVQKIPLQPLDSIRESLNRRVENDSRATIAREAQQERVKKQFHFKEYPQHFAALIEAIPADSLKEKGFKAADYTHFTQPVMELDGKKYTQHDFMVYAAELTRGRVVGLKQNAFGDLFKMFQNKKLSDLQMANLEKNNSEFKHLLNEYREGILLFALTEENVWGKASKDTAGLEVYYNQHRDRYNWSPGFEGTVYQSADIDFLHQLARDVNAGVAVDEALDKINIPENPKRITMQTGRYAFTEFSLAPQDYAESKYTKVFINPDGTPTMIFASKVHTQPMPKSLIDARGFVVADYQDFLEKQWNEELKKKYPLKINEKTLKSIKK